MSITHEYARDHRPLLKQAVLELVVSQDGGILFVSKRGDTNTSDSRMVQARTQASPAAFKSAPSPQSLIADSKRYHEDTAPHLRDLSLIMRILNTMGAVAEAITQALTLDRWARRAEKSRDQRLELCHEGMAQRWLVVSSQAALERAEATLNNARTRADEAIPTQPLHLQAKRFAMVAAAEETLTAWAKGWASQQVDSYHLSDHPSYGRKGRQTSSKPIQAIEWPIRAHVRPHEAVIGTHSGASPLSDTKVIAASQRQSRVEGGFRFLKEPMANAGLQLLCLAGTAPRVRVAEATSPPWPKPRRTPLPAMHCEVARSPDGSATKRCYGG
jgi:transposase